jgi:AraC-like DNA-binding protein
MARPVRYPLMRSQLAVATIAHVRKSGGDADALIARFGLPEDVEQRSEITLRLDALREFFEQAAAALRDPLLGVHMARAMNRGAFGVLAFSSRSAPTVREALTRLARYIRLSNDTVEVGFVEDAREGAIHQRVPGHPQALGRHANEFFVALLLEEGRRLLGPRHRPSRVWLAHRAPRGLSLASELGVDEVTFLAEQNGLAFPHDVLDLPMVTSDDALSPYLEAQAEKALAALAAEPGLVAEVRRVVREELGKGPSALARIARLLGMSRRTLQRRLEEEETSFQRLVDEAREEIARALVADASVPLSRVARAAGYSDERPFLRAFKRWTGLTPTAYREQRSAG